MVISRTWNHFAWPRRCHQSGGKRSQLRTPSISQRVNDDCGHDATPHSKPDNGSICEQPPSHPGEPFAAQGRSMLLACAFAERKTGLRMSKSSLALSNLRGFVILLVVAFHSVLAYLGSQPASQAPFDSPPYHWKAFAILDSERWFGFDLFRAFQYVYLMHFMFFLSGLFVWSSLQRKGGMRFLYDRCLRLGVPLVLGVYLLMPLAHSPVSRATPV